MSDRRFEPDQIYDLPALPPDATHDELLEHQQREDQWRRTREPVATGSKFLKFITWADLVKAGIITVSDVVGNNDPDSPDDPPDDPNDPDSPDFVNEPRLAVYARDMFLPVTYACSALTVIENANTKPNLQVLLFDASTYESAQFVLILPKEWPGRALRYRVYWSHGSGATAYDVSWDMTVHSYEDGESLLTDWATGLQITDTGGTADTVYITNESAAVTVNGALAKPHDLLIFRITRLAAEASDTLDVDARLHAVEFNIGAVDADFEVANGFGFDPTLNPTFISYSGSFNSVITKLSNGVNYLAKSLRAHSTGKLYFAFVNTSESLSDGTHIGVISPTSPLTFPGELAGDYGCQINRVAGVGTWTNFTFTSLAGSTIVGVGDTAMMAIDFDAGKIWYGRNGTWFNSGDPAAGTGPNQTFTPNPTFHVVVSDAYIAVRTCYFAPTAPYAPPSGFAYWDT